MKLNKKMILTSIVALIMLLCTSTVHAAIQSSGGTVANKDAITWMKSIRQMEGVGGGFGLSETINSNLTSSSGSNNIDVHMEKNTEYGAMAILSASSYGNPNKITNGQTTTGNETGIVLNLSGYNTSTKVYSYECTASTFHNTDTIAKMHSKYRNSYYDNNGAARIGDATAETYKWHGSDSRTFGSSDIRFSNHMITRGYYNKSIFDYLSDGVTMYGGSYNYRATRCVVIVGEGI